MERIWFQNLVPNMFQILAHSGTKNWNGFGSKFRYRGSTHIIARCKNGNGFGSKFWYQLCSKFWYIGTALVPKFSIPDRVNFCAEAPFTISHAINTRGCGGWDDSSRCPKYGGQVETPRGALSTGGNVVARGALSTGGKGGQLVAAAWRRCGTYGGGGGRFGK